MKIAYLLTQSLDSPSGLGRYGPLARALANKGHQLEIYALHPDFESLEHKRFVSQGVQVHYVAPMHVKKKGNLKSYYPTWKLVLLTGFATLKLTLAALRSKADIIHVCKPHPMNSIAGLAARYLSGKRLFLDCDDYETASSRFGGQWQRRGVAFFERKMPFFVHAVTTNTHFMENLLQSWGVRQERLVYLPNGVERSRMRPPEPVEVAKLRQEIGLENKQVISFIGTLSLPSHPVDLLIRAFAELSPRQPDAALLLVGGGEDFDLLKQMVTDLGLSERVVFTGRVLPERAAAYYVISDVSVDPVFDDEAARGRSPLKLFESWACGTPFVTADVGDRCSLLGDPPAGLLAKEQNPHAYASAIEQILNDKNLAESLRQRGRKRVEKFYWDSLAEAVEAYYLQTTQPKARSDNPRAET